MRELSCTCCPPWPMGAGPRRGGRTGGRGTDGMDGECAMCVAVRPSRFEWVGSWLLLRLLGPWPCLMVMPGDAGAAPRPGPGQAQPQGRGSERSAALNFTNTMAIHNGRQRSEDRTAKSPRSCRWHAVSHVTTSVVSSTRHRHGPLALPLPGTYVRTRTRMPGGQLLSSATLTTRSPCCPNLFVPVEQHQRAPRTLPSTLHRSTTHVLPASQTSQPFTAKPVSVRRTSLQIDPHAGACSPARRH